MTPEDSDPQLSAEDEERVRRALAASAPGPAAMPHDVAARLDDVLARLVAERREADGPGGFETVAAGPPQPPADAAQPPQPPSAEPEDELAARRRRRLGPRLLVAAASVAALAVGSGVLLNLTAGSGGGAASTSAGRAAEDRASAADRPSGADMLGAQGETPGAPAQAPAAPGAARLRALQVAVPLPRLHTVSLTADVRRVAAHDARTDPTNDTSGTLDRRAARYPCALPAPVRGGRLVAVRLDGKRATLVLGPARDGTRVARVYSCDDGADPVAETSVTRR